MAAYQMNVVILMESAKISMFVNLAMCMENTVIRHVTLGILELIVISCVTVLKNHATYLLVNVQMAAANWGGQVTHAIKNVPTVILDPTVNSFVTDVLTIHVINSMAVVTVVVKRDSWVLCVQLEPIQPLLIPRCLLK